MISINEWEVVSLATTSGAWWSPPQSLRSLWNQMSVEERFWRKRVSASTSRGSMNNMLIRRHVHVVLAFLGVWVPLHCRDAGASGR
jgi:hypothetical protein